MRETKTLAIDVEFPQQLAALRHMRNLTQQVLADRVGVHVMQIRRYEGAKTQPTLEVIKSLALALSVSTDQLIFGDVERGPDDDLRLQFEAVTRFDPEDKKIVKALLDGMILKHEAKRWSG